MEAVNAMTNEYRYLEFLSHPWRKQPRIKGTGKSVWDVVCWMRINHFTPEQVAQDGGLLLEAVLEALDYYEKNKELVDAEAQEEKRLLQEKWGYQFD